MPLPLTRPRAALAALTLALLAAPAALAQRATPDPFAPGTRVRIHLRDVHRQVPGASGPALQDLRGTVVRSTTDSVVLDLRPGIAAVPRAAITRMGVSRGVSSRLESGLRNAVGGAFIGGILGVVATTHEDDSRWETVGRYAGAVAAASFVTGLIWPAERWRRVPRTMIVAPAAGGGAAAGGRLEF